MLLMSDCQLKMLHPHPMTEQPKPLRDNRNHLCRPTIAPTSRYTNSCLVWHRILWLGGILYLAQGNLKRNVSRGAAAVRWDRSTLHVPILE